ncbi:MAG: leucine-rich repeat protein [Dysgonamonadaceae bacterium]|jgi:hypothetical protein|nr:leucine-rich repeat protein [Dysgonamonadaceae bacterium]
MKKSLFSLIVAFLLIISNLTAQVSVNVATAGGLKDAVKAQQPNLELVTGLIVAGTIDATDFRFIRDSLNSTLQTLDLSGVTIVAYSGMEGTDYTAPNTLGVGGGADKDASYLANEIPVSAFYKTWKLNSLTAAYVKMTALTSIVLPVGITKINKLGLAGMQIQSLDLSNLMACTELGEQVFANCSALQTLVLPNVTTLTLPFAGCSSLQRITIPCSVTTLVGNNFFSSCRSLQSVTFEEPCQITTLPFRMFYSSPTEEDMDMRIPLLQTVTVPASVTNVSTAFENFIGTAIECDPNNTVYYSKGGVLYKKPGPNGELVSVPKGITSFTIPVEMDVIPSQMFANCTKLTHLTILSNLTEIGDRAFYNTGITSFNFPGTLVKIGNEAFKNSKLRSVTITNNATLTNLGSSIFANCNFLETADLSGLGNLGVSMFQASVNLKTVTLQSSLTAIPTAAFSGANKLDSINLPNSIQVIGKNAFMDCFALTGITLPASLDSLGSGAFTNDYLIDRFILPTNFSKMGIDENIGTPFTNTYGEITVSSSNPYFSSENGILYNREKTKLLYIPMSRTRKAVSVSNTVDTIMSYAFLKNADSNIYKLTLPNSVKYIEGLHAASTLDTLVVKGMEPPLLGSNNALNNQHNSARPLVMVPARKKPLYIAAAGWKLYYDPTNSYGNGAHDLFIQQAGFHDMGNGMAIAVSPNGKYVVGNAGSNSAYLFKIDEDTRQTIPNATAANDINDKMYIAAKHMETYNNNVTINTGAVYRDNKWYSIGLGRFGALPTNSEVTTDITCIDSTGNVYGATYEKGSFAKITPFAWKYNAASGDNAYKTDTMAFASPANFAAGDQGAKIKSISSDGTVAGGWTSRMIYAGVRSAVGWKSPANYILFDENSSSEAGGVSPSGRYITTQKDRRAALYDIVNDTLIIFGPDNSYCTGVSDNGFVVGFQRRGNVFENGRQAFIWSDKLGFFYFRQFIDKYASTAEITDNTFFGFPNESAVFDTPTDISADGLVITGWSGYGVMSTKGWVLCLPDTLDLIDRPRALNANVNITQRNVVNLSWQAPSDFDSNKHTLDFYFIYRDGVKIAQTDASEGTTYTDNDAPDGYLKYNVSAVFDYDLQTGKSYLESGKTDYVEVTIVDNYNLPFADGFEGGAFKQNYWTNQTKQTSAWHLFKDNSFNGIYAVTFIGNGDSQKYDLSLTSKPFDAIGKNNIHLTCMYRILSEQEIWAGVRDTIYIEIGTGNNTWTKVKTIVVNGAHTWLPFKLDISSAAANQLFRVRFHAVSGANRNAYNFNMDDFGVGFEETSISPSSIIAYKYSDENNVNVIYKDIAGSYGLTYTDGKMFSSISNLGKSIITANKYDRRDLKPLEGKYLSSISAFLISDYPETSPSQLKLAVFKNGDRIESSDIVSWNGHAWNNFPLANPILITDETELLVGIEQSGDPVNRVLSIDLDSIGTNPKANLYSEDDGETWLYASDKRIWGNWGITANFRDESSTQHPDDDVFDVLYQIYRNDVALDTLHYGQKFVDNSPVENACYTVKVFRSPGGMSPISAQGCVQILTGLPKIEYANLKIYPNPASDFIHIEGDFDSVGFYDGLGRLLHTAKQKDINIKGWSSGIYLVKTTLTDGTTALSKLIVR